MGRCKTIVKKLFFIDEGLLLTDMEVTYKREMIIIKKGSSSIPVLVVR